jgi:hypothetical protein
MEIQIQPMVRAAKTFPPSLSISMHHDEQLCFKMCIYINLILELNLEVSATYLLFEVA